MEKLRQSIELRIKELYSRYEEVDKKIDFSDGSLSCGLIEEQRVILARIDELQGVLFNITRYA